MVCVWFGVVLWVRFPADDAPEKWLLTRHRGSNRLPEERKTEAETSCLPADGKAKGGNLRKNRKTATGDAGGLHRNATGGRRGRRRCLQGIGRGAGLN